MTLSEFLNYFDFDYEKDETGNYWLIDLQGAYLGNIGDESFSNIPEIVNRLETYYTDYIYRGISETDLIDEDAVCYEGEEYYPDILEWLKQNYGAENYLTQIVNCIVHPELITEKEEDGEMTNTDLKLENALLQLELTVKEIELFAATRYPDIFDILQCSSYNQDEVIDAVIDEYGTSSVLADMGLADIMNYFEIEEIVDYCNKDDILNCFSEDDIKEYVADSYYPEDWVEVDRVEFNWNY